MAAAAWSKTADPQTSAPTPGASAVALFSSGGSTAAQSLATAAPPAVAAPTVESVFGANAWEASPCGTGPGGATCNYNPQYFATPQTAGAVAQLLGGSVVEMNAITSAPGSTFQQQQPNEMVRLKNGALINPGLVAGFYTHGYPQSLVDQMIANEVANVSANT